MRYSLRTLLIVMLLGGPLCAWGWKAYQAEVTRLEFERRKLFPDSMTLGVYPYDSTDPRKPTKEYVEEGEKIQEREYEEWMARVRERAAAKSTSEPQD